MEDNEIKKNWSNEVWDTSKKKFVETPENIIQFLNDIDELCKKHNLSISHEDSHGGFIIEKYSDRNLNWLSNTSINLKGAN